MTGEKPEDREELEGDRRKLLDEIDGLRRERDRLLEREAHFAQALSVADGGQYRNDWDGAIRRVLAEVADLRAKLAALSARHAVVYQEAKVLNASLWDTEDDRDGVQIDLQRVTEERDALLRRIAGRATAPTHAEIAAHPGRWLMRRRDGCLQVVRHRTVLRSIVTAALSDKSHDVVWWWPIDEQGCVVPWPIVLEVPEAEKGGAS